MQIDIDKLRELVADPKAKTKDIVAALGFKNDVTFYYNLKQDPEAKAIFDARPGARAKSAKSSAKAPRKSSNRKSETGNRKSSTPRNPNAKGNNKELFKKLLHEFDHIDLYGATSEHFDELREEISKQ